MLAIIILNWNGFSDTKACVESLFAATLPARQLFIVDNGSKPEQKSQIASFCQEKNLTFIDLPENTGFAEGNNIAMRKALENPRITHFLLLNNDTTLEPDCIMEMLQTLKSHPKAAIINPQIFYHATPRTIWANGSVYHPWIGKSFLRKTNTIESDAADIPLTQIVGCCMLLPREAVETVGLMDAHYFSYYEETDWAERFKKAGYELWLSAKAKLYHKVAQSTGGGHTPFATYYLMRNRGYFIQKNLRFPQRFVAFASLYGECFVRFLLYLFTNKPALRSATWRGFMDFLAGKKGPTFEASK